MAVTHLTDEVPAATGPVDDPDTTRRRAPRAADYCAGIIGTGFMGRVHARAVLVAGGRVTGVAASSPARAERAAADLPGSRPFETAAALVDSPDVDVVHVCTPNHLHHALALRALEAGKHVVCEKPLATSAADAAELAERAAALGLVGTVPFVYRFHPMVREARELVRSGGLGRVTLAHGSYLQDWLTGPQDDDWRVDPSLGGPSRAFGDIGSHWCDLLEFVTGERITAVSAHLATVNGTRGERRQVRTEDVVTLQLQTTGGAVGACVVSQVSPGRKNRLMLEVSGTEGTLTFDQERPEELWHGRRDASRLVLRDPGTLSPAAARYARLPAGHAQGYQDCFDAFVADTALAVRGEAPDGLPTFADGARAALLAETVLASSASGCWTPVP
jgi:predicted dehydrogenase